MTISVRPHAVVDVDLFDEHYELVPVTRAVHEQCLAIDVELIAAATGPLEAYLELVGRGLDIRLKRTRPKQPKPSTTLLKAWRADQVTGGQVDDLLEQIAAYDRPTGPQRTT